MLFPRAIGKIKSLLLNLGLLSISLRETLFLSRFGNSIPTELEPGITEILASPYGDSQMITTVSSFGTYCAEFGLIFISVYFYLFYFSNKNINGYTIIASTLSFILILQSFSILFPPTYLLLATCMITRNSHLKPDE